MTSPSHGRPTGRFTFDAAPGKWDWDDDVFRIHGLAPGSVTPTTELSPAVWFSWRVTD